MTTKGKKLLKSRDALPDWFPLPIYKAELTPEKWLEALVWRASAQTVFTNTGNKHKAKEVFERLIISNEPDKSERPGLLHNGKDASQIWGIRELSAFDAAYLAAMVTGSDSGKKLTRALENIRAKKDLITLVEGSSSAIERSRKESFSQLVDWASEPFEMTDVFPRFPVMVDLDQDDETLKLAFEVWLAGVRDTLGPAPKPIGEKDFRAWEKYGVLPAFDLYFWSRIHDIKFSDALIANAIWPHAEFDNTERLRKVTRPKADEVFSWKLIQRFWRQLELEKALDKLFENRNEKV